MVEIRKLFSEQCKSFERIYLNSTVLCPSYLKIEKLNFYALSKSQIGYIGLEKLQFKLVEIL